MATQVSEATRQGWSNKIKSIIKAKQEKLAEFNDWEWDFVLNIEYRMEHGKDLTMQQSIILNKLYGRLV